VRDTSPEVERKFHKMLMQRSGEERLKMGCSMHATAVALAKAALLQRHPGADPAKLKRLLFLHFYGNDFAPEERERIASALERCARDHDRKRKVSTSNPGQQSKKRNRREQQRP
jgi:hypothetical protein